MPRLKRFVLGATTVALAVSGVAAVAHAAPLTTEQRAAVLNLLQSYNADADVVAKVRAVLASVDSNDLDFINAKDTLNAKKCYTFAANVRQGSVGEAVSALQGALAKDGIEVSGTGVYDAQTVRAVTAFQEKYASIILNPIGLAKGTGYVGAATRVQLNKMYGCAGGGSTVPALPFCGQPPFVCNAPEGAACGMIMPAPKTYTDHGTYKADRATFLYNGSCRTENLSSPSSTVAQ
jgi:peptidoglycan hydrolase-like protein with peptidoglycan-binding domain